MLISDPAERQLRAISKREKILSFLADEVWSSSDILQQLLRLKARQPLLRSLNALERQGLVKRAHTPVLAGQGVTVWGISRQGRAIMDGCDVLGPVFEPSKLRLSSAPHHLALQHARVRAENAGWTDWTRGSGLRGPKASQPDAVATTLSGVRVAVEVELTIKSRQRYQAILAAHLNAVRRGDYVGVYYVASPDIVWGLERLFLRIERLNEGIAFDANVRSRFKLVPSDQFS
ncbi:hypothetical protein E1162_15110 [Rhodobacteraceae bacterium RKSG542]|uniref:MobC family replication-relaxation protein n=1 Tax=Pseudovibrio flavus TaxID=2529854 RepID=UPI0012BCC5C9|nr:MobC family replication-relaxation protein [Pseudovibrio flavus]MTI18573.1 hypothetical protein [Pseudovibrio flavus]